MIEHNGKHMVITKRDWKLFREKLPGWQEAYMGRLIEEYKELLSGPSDASDKFWKLEKRIRKDKKNPGVLLEMNKGTMIQDIASMVYDGVIAMDDLSDFSEDVRDAVNLFLHSFLL